VDRIERPQRGRIHPPRQRDDLRAERVFGHARERRIHLVCHVGERCTAHRPHRAGHLDPRQRRRHQQVSLGVVPAGSVVVGITLR
jgi:hypothetical protein